MDVGEGGGVAEHLDVECADEVLLEELGLDVFGGHLWFECLQLVQYDLILFLFGLSLADALNKLLQLFR